MRLASPLSQVRERVCEWRADQRDRVGGCDDTHCAAVYRWVCASLPRRVIFREAGGAAGTGA